MNCVVPLPLFDRRQMKLLLFRHPGVPRSRVLLMNFVHASMISHGRMTLLWRVIMRSNNVREIWSSFWMLTNISFIRIACAMELKAL